jgi:hypothetical protein
LSKKKRFRKQFWKRHSKCRTLSTTRKHPRQSRPQRGNIHESEESRIKCSKKWRRQHFMPRHTAQVKVE